MKTKVITTIMLMLFLASMLSIWSQSIVAQPPSGMVSYWRLDEGSGTTAYDSVGDNDGTLINDPIWTTGIVDGALSFDGVDDYVDVGYHDFLNSANDFSYSVWIKLNNNITGGGIGRAMIISLHNGPYLNFELATGKLRSWLFIGTEQYLETNKAVWDRDTWYHIGVTFDESVWKIYVNGELDNERSGGIKNVVGDDYHIKIGKNHWQDRWYFNGTMDEIAIFNRALTAEEIQQHYQNGLNGLGYYIEMMTAAYLDFAPDPVGVGQTLVIIGWIDPEPPTGYYYEGLTLTITDPTPSSVEMGPFTSDSQGAIWVTYVPSIEGAYSVELFCPEQTFGEETYSSSTVVESFIVEPGPVDPNYVPEGYDVPVFSDPEVGLVFDHVIGEGSVQVGKSMIGPPPDVGSLIGPYYYITTTAAFSDDITVRIFYDDTGLTLEQEQALRMIQTDIVPGDVNLDGIVNWRDIRAIARALPSYPGYRRWNPSCDLNKDDEVNTIDLLIAVKNRGMKSQWTDITLGVDTVNNIIIGITDHLDESDPFGVR